MKQGNDKVHNNLTFPCEKLLFLCLSLHDLRTHFYCKRGHLFIIVNASAMERPFTTVTRHTLLRNIKLVFCYRKNYFRFFLLLAYLNMCYDINSLSSCWKEWNKHWFVLRGAALLYYRDPSAEDQGILDGVIDLSGVSSVTEVQVARNYGFQTTVSVRLTSQNVCNFTFCFCNNL